MTSFQTLVLIGLANLAALLYLIFRAQQVVIMPMVLAMANKEAELIVLRQTLIEARNAFAMMRAQQEQAKGALQLEKPVAKTEV